MIRKNINRKKLYDKYNTRYVIFNNWKVDLYNEDKSKNTKRFMAECLLCNIEKFINFSDVRSGKSKQCRSCSTIHIFTKHGDSVKNNGKPTRLYRIWNNMKSRCNNNLRGYKNVTYDSTWNDYSIFKTWALNNGYKNNLTIDKDIMSDKINNGVKLYSPKTCIWIDLESNTRYANLNRKHTKEQIIKTIIRKRTIPDEDIIKAKKLIDVDISYSDILKITKFNHQSELSALKYNQMKTIKELQEQLFEIQVTNDELVWKE